jgi:hypothetical protein
MFIQKAMTYEEKNDLYIIIDDSENGNKQV